MDLLHEVNSEDMIVFLAGNKYDLIRNDGRSRKITYDEAFKYSKDNFIDVVAECSAKDGTNIKAIFEQFLKGGVVTRCVQTTETVAGEKD